MNIKRALWTVFIICVVISVFAFGRQIKPAASSQEQKSTQHGNSIPEHIIYEQAFNSLIALKNAKDYQRHSGLNDEQAVAFEQVAKDCQREVAEQDAKAFKIINAFREKLKIYKSTSSPIGSPGDVRPDNQPPQPPLELKKLQEERDAIILRHRDRLLVSLGEEKFKQLDQSIRRLLQISIVAVPTP